MKTNHKIIFGAFLLLVGVALAMWLRREQESRSPQSGNSARQAATTPAGPVQASPVSQQSQTVTKSGAPVTSQKKFSDMDILEARAIASEIGKRDLPAIFQAMIDADRVEQDSQKQFRLKKVFSNALNEKKPSPDFLEQLYGFINDRANSEFERSLLIGALQEAATAETFDLLVRVANSSSDKKMREYAGSLGGAGDNPQNRLELSPILERTWRETGNPTLIRSTAVAMARIGKPSGIELLLSAALATDERDKKRQIAAESALWEVFVGDAVPPLAARLANQPPTSAVVKLVAPILARTNGPVGQEALVSWLQSRSENAAPLVHDLIRQQIRTDPFESAWAKALEPGAAFNNEENRKAIREALDAYRAARISR
jgi:hypothetical protein